MPHHPRLRRFIEWCEVQQTGYNLVRFWMGLYGGRSPKPCMLFGTAWGCLTFALGLIGYVFSKHLESSFLCSLRPYVVGVANKLTKPLRVLFHATDITKKYVNSKGERKVHGP